VPALLQQADALVLCSDDEGMPNVVMEAMAAGVPVVTTPVGDAPRLVEDGVCGVIVPCGDARAIAEQLVALTEQPGLRRELGRKGRERVRGLHGIEGLAERVLGVYRAVAAREAPDLLAIVGRGSL
jgi:glycosyltransferase involved in cell wall biosynthesis